MATPLEPAVPQPPPPKGGPPPEQIEKTIRWVNGRFRVWYATHPVDLPPRHGKREFAFMWLGKTFMLRHQALTSRAALNDRLTDVEPPAHVYYSTAYYKHPGAPTMKEKEWLGADLIFDLDADHLPNAAALSFEEQLVAVKTQVVKLVEDFLLRDFGFAREHLRVVFSGGRGYHVHVTDPRVLELGSAERREIVDYVSPNETVLKDVLADFVATRGVAKNDFGNVEKSVRIPPADSPGWAGRFTRTAVAYLETVATMPEEQAVKELRRHEGIGTKTAHAIYQNLTPAKLARLREDGALDQFAELGRGAVLQALLAQAIIVAPGETDEPVTADIKRLIRMPGTLHGKTGFRVTPIPLDHLRDFDPLTEAIAFDDEPVRVIVSRPEKIRLGDTVYEPVAGPQELPLKVAMFLALRRRALVPLA
ncbi:MAG: DNA primase catalytic subunit PriS [Thermoplasmatota archaeon]